MRAATTLLALFLLTLSGCGGTETVTVTETQVVTETVEKTETVTVTIQPEPTVFVPQAGGTPEFKPDQLFTGVSGGGWVVERWISYGGETAEALAYTEFNDCEPSCAEGNLTRADATIQLSQRIPCKGVVAYGRLSVKKTSDEALLSSGFYENREPLCHEGE